MCKFYILYELTGRDVFQYLNEFMMTLIVVVTLCNIIFMICFYSLGIVE